MRRSAGRGWGREAANPWRAPPHLPLLPCTLQLASSLARGPDGAARQRMVAPARRLEVRAISYVQGPDRKSPVDGVPAEPALTEPDRRSLGSPPRVSPHRPPPPTD